MEEIEQLQQDNNYNELALVAHWLKGAGGSVGFDILSDIGRDLEEAARNAAPQDISKLVHNLRGASERIVGPSAA